MRNLFEIILLVFIWIGFSNDYSVLNLLFAVGISSVIVFSINRSDPVKFGVNPARVLLLLLLILYELIKSSIEVSLEVLKLTNKRRPDIIYVPLGCKNNFQKALLANLISLTPGTLSIDLTKDQNQLILHVLFANQQEELLKFIKQKLEPNVMRAFYVK